MKKKDRPSPHTLTLTKPVESKTKTPRFHGNHSYAYNKKTTKKEKPRDQGFF